MEITKDMLVGEIVEDYPDLVGTMLEHGMQCIGCCVATWETLEQGALGHGVDVHALVKDLNAKLRGD
ncbi:MAG: DUF1858 domain-containing protein [archaeon]